MMMMIMMKMMLMILAMVIVCGQSGHFCSNDHDLMDYMDEIAQVVSINCTVSANPSNDLVFRFQSFANICLSRRSQSLTWILPKRQMVYNLANYVQSYNHAFNLIYISNLCQYFITLIMVSSLKIAKTLQMTIVLVLVYRPKMKKVSSANFVHS